MKRAEAEMRRPSFIRLMGVMLRLAFHTHPVMFIVFLLSSLGFTALLIADLHFIRLLLDRLPLFSDGRISIQAVVVTILLLVGVNIIDTLMNAVLNLSYEYLSSLADARMVETMGVKASRLELINFESTGFFDGIEKAHAGRSCGFDAMETIVFSLIFHGGYFLFLAIYLLQVEPLLVLGVFAAFLPVAISRLVRASTFYKAETRVAPLRREFNHYEACLVDRIYYKETRTSGAVPFFRRKYDQVLAAYNQEMWHTELRTGMIDVGLKVLTLAGYAGLLFLLVRFTILGRVSVGLFGAVYFSMDSIFKWFEELFDRLGSAVENAAYGSNYLAFLDLPERKSGHLSLPRNRGVELRQVSFRYPGTSTNAVEDVNLVIEPGSTVAIVGENGAGKSSLVRLIAGLYHPDNGSVLVGGINVCDSTAGSRFQRLSSVFQHFQRYHMTLFDNIRIAESASSADGSAGKGERERASTALEHAGFQSHLDGVDRADLDVMLAREFGGIDLSGGEWQRLAIARGLYRTHDTIILDEPTAAIDPIEEDRVYRMFLKLARGRMAIIVTHRLGLTRLADRILVMDRGRIIQDGTHAGLMASGGMYARMFRAQAAWYQPVFETDGG